MLLAKGRGSLLHTHDELARGEKNRRLPPEHVHLWAIKPHMTSKIEA